MVCAMADETIDLQAAAARLGVHYQTAYKWVRSGELRATMVMGSYRLDGSVVDRFAERRARPVRPAQRRSRADLAELSKRVFAHLVAGEEREARRLVDGLLDAGVSITTAAQEVLVPPLAQIGDQWGAGRLEVSVEHRACAIVERILGAHYPNPRGRRRGAAVIAALSGDRHALPTTMAAVALREDNWRVHHLGADLPAAELLSFCHRQPFDLAVLTVTCSCIRDASISTAAELEGLGVPTLVGGPGRTLLELQRLARNVLSAAGDVSTGTERQSQTKGETHGTL